MHSHVLKGQGTERSRGIAEHSSASVLVNIEALLEIRFETAFGFCQSDRTQNDMRHVATRHSIQERQGTERVARDHRTIVCVVP